MKKKLIIAAFLFSFFGLSGQDKPYISLEFGTSYFYYFVGNAHNSFNYGFSLLMSENIKRSKISLGVFTSTLNYFITYNPPYEIDSLQKKVFNTGFLNFPISYTYRFYSSEKIDLGFQAGFIFDYAFKSDVTYYYLKKPSEKESITAKNKSSIKVRGAFLISKVISKHFRINILPFADFILKSDTEEYPSYKKHFSCMVTWA